MYDESGSRPPRRPSAVGWTVVVAGLAAIGAVQVTMLALLWRRAGAAR